MPIYYKKVSRNASDAVNFIEKTNRFKVGVKNKIAVKRGNSIPGINGDTAAVELKNIEIDLGVASPLIPSPGKSRPSSEFYEERQLVTSYGTVTVAREGADAKSGKPVILTFHDIGLNSASNFGSFFSTPENKLLLESFSVIHVNAPGQEEGAPALPDDFVYPTTDQLAQIVAQVVNHYSIKQFIGFGYGLGAYVLTRFALEYPDLVEGLILIHPNVTQSSWTEWFYQKMNLRAIAKNLTPEILPDPVQNYLLWHHFGNIDHPDREGEREIYEYYADYLKETPINPHNLGMLIDSYVRRSNLPVSRESRIARIRCPVLILCGDYSPHVEDGVTVNSRLDPSNTSWMKIQDCAMILEEKPEKVSQAMRLFFQGLGYTLRNYEKKRALLSGHGVSMPCLSSLGHIDSAAARFSQRRMTVAVDP